METLVYEFNRLFPEGSSVVLAWPELDEVDMSDNVNHPSHYTAHPSGVECIEITQHYNFCIGNAIKYLWRAGLKRDIDKSVQDKEVEDLKKALWYINREISIIENAQS